MSKHLERMPPQVKRRFDRRKNKKFTGNIHVFEEWNGFKAHAAVRCPGGCGDALQSLIPDADLGVRQRKVEGTSTVIQEIYMVLRASINYDMIRLAMDDGSEHMMPLCKSCKRDLQHEDLESLYAAGLEAFAQEDHEKNIPIGITQRFLNEMNQKKVVAQIMDGKS